MPQRKYLHLYGNVCPLWHVLQCQHTVVRQTLSCSNIQSEPAGTSVNKLSLSSVFGCSIFLYLSMPQRVPYARASRMSTAVCVIKNRSLHADHLFMHAPKPKINFQPAAADQILIGFAAQKAKQRHSKIKPKPFFWAAGDHQASFRVCFPFFRTCFNFLQFFVCGINERQHAANIPHDKFKQ